MKLALRLVPVLAGALLVGACGSRQTPSQQVAQLPLTAQPAAQDTPAPQPPPAAEQPAVNPAAPDTLPAPAMPQYAPAPIKPAPIGPATDATPPPAYGNAAPAYGNAAPSTIAIPAGTRLNVRLEETIDTKRNRAGDRFDATLTSPIVVDQQTLVPRGTRLTGHLIESRPSGRLKGHAELSLCLDSLDLHGQHYSILTTDVARASKGHKKRNWTLIGGGGGFGSAVGAIAAGPMGALIGAGAGAGAGTVGAVFTGKKNVRIPVETQLAFALREPVTLAN